MSSASQTSATNVCFLTALEAASLDQKLMSSSIGYTLPVLMELAGLSVAHGVHDFLNATPSRIAIAAGPGNNGGDGLVAARHLVHMGHEVRVIRPNAASREPFIGLEKLLQSYEVPVLTACEITGPADVIVDAVFGFSFTPRGDAGVSGKYAELLESVNNHEAPVVCVDVPSGWHVDKGDVYNGISIKNPAAVISLTLPKMCMKEPHEEKRFKHYIGGRFVPKKLQEELGIEVPAYEGNSVFRRLV